MTVMVNIGRRVPKSWHRRIANKAGGLLTFSQNIWLMIRQSMQLAKRKATEDGRLNFTITYETESEDLNYNLEWIKVIIQGTKDMEEEEYNESMKLYEPLKNALKSNLDLSKAGNALSKHFNSKVLSPEKVEEAYSKGYGVMTDKNIANKLLEMGILTHIEWIQDFDKREPHIPNI